MMGYTHAIVGASGALAYAISYGDGTPELYVVAVISGTLGGVAVDIDARDNKTNPKVTDASRSRFAVLGLLGLGLLSALLMGSLVLKDIFNNISTAILGVVIFIVICLVGYLSPHRTFSHSLLFVVASTLGVSLVCLSFLEYYFIGSILHLLVDMLNNPFQGHGVWLFYPIKTGKGIAFGLCKAARIGNKITYFIGMSLFLGLSYIYLWDIRDIVKLIVPFAVIIYLIVVLHFVRVKSEREQRHIMHMHGEL